VKTVFEFIDYRKYLAWYYQEKRSTFRHFSFRFFARKAGISSPSFLKHVIDGKRNLTRPVIEKFCTALALNKKEAIYFRNMVLFNQAKTSEEKQEHYAVLRSLSGVIQEAVLKTDQYDYFANWYTAVIRELVCTFDFKDDYARLAGAVIPRILPSQAKDAVKLLARLHFVKRRADGTYQQINPSITADSAITSLAVRAFTKAMIEHSKNALDAIEKSKRHISGLTLGVSPGTYSVLATEIEAFKDRVKTIVSRDANVSRIYQMNLALFPLSEEIAEADTVKGDRQ
jgi:uncharacterized protein (TIGR02147 family)